MAALLGVPEFEAVLDALDCCFQHGDAGPLLLIAGNEMPRGGGVVGAFEHVLGGLVVEVALLAISPVFVRELPLPERVFFAAVEPLELFVGTDMHPELDDDGSFDREAALKADDLVVSPGPLLNGRKFFDPFDEDTAVPAAVEHAHAASARDLAPEPPEEVVAKLA